MCGFAGFLGFRGLAADSAGRVVLGMARAIQHRGPDAEGTWIDPEAEIALGHRRLSVIDLSEAGHQPMVSASGRYVIAYNGEIYNHGELRSDLGTQLVWRGHSDTETLLAAIETWGLERTLQRCVGMFAIALWDRQLRTLSLARDRLGEKPLYYGWHNGVFLFGSELKALQAHPLFQGVIDRGAVAAQLRYSAIPAPYSIYQGIHKLLPGTFMEIRGMREADPQPRAFWSLEDAIADARSDPFHGSDEEAIDRFGELLARTVRGQMAADVPLGTFLSGGIDSSLITAVMQSQSTRPVQTFTIGFEDRAYNEADYARRIARHLGCEHSELYVSASDALAVIPRLPAIYDEPFSDASQIPTFLVSRLARGKVTVSLSGDGGDELFGGYSRYLATQKWWPRITRMPVPVRRAAAAGLLAVDAGTWNRLARSIPRRAHAPGAAANLGNTVQKVAGALRATDDTSLYRHFVSHWQDPAGVVMGATEPPFPQLGGRLEDSSLAERMMALDARCYLPDDILVKVDRAAMAVGLETRVPFLDHRLVEFGWRLPLEVKIRHGHGKWLLRQLLYRHVPRELVERPKMGFAVPLDSWLRGPLRDWGESLLDARRLRDEGVFDPDAVRRPWEEHQSGRRNWQNNLWDVLMFQAWKEEQR